MRALIVLALVTSATLAHAQSNSKKELVAKLLELHATSSSSAHGREWPAPRCSSR